MLFAWTYRNFTVTPRPHRARSSAAQRKKKKEGKFSIFCTVMHCVWTPSRTTVVSMTLRYVTCCAACCLRALCARGSTSRLKLVLFCCLGNRNLRFATTKSKLLHLPNYSCDTKTLPVNQKSVLPCSLNIPVSFAVTSRCGCVKWHPSPYLRAWEPCCAPFHWPRTWWDREGRVLCAKKKPKNFRLVFARRGSIFQRHTGFGSSERRALHSINA